MDNMHRPGRSSKAFVDRNQYPDLQDVVSSNKRFNTRQISHIPRLLPGEIDPDDYDPKPPGRVWMPY